MRLSTVGKPWALDIGIWFELFRRACTSDRTPMTPISTIRTLLPLAPSARSGCGIFRRILRGSAVFNEGRVADKSFWRTSQN